MVEKLLQITQEFIDLLSREHHLLKTHKLGEASRLHPEKDRLNGEYQLATLQFRSQAKHMHDVPMHVLEFLHDKTRELKERLTENERLLVIVAEANNRIINALAERLNSRTAIVEGYSRFGGVMDGKLRRAEALAVSANV